MKSAAGDRVHLVGVGGSGMSGLACFLRDRGVEVTGSERASDPAVLTRIARLREAGCEVTLGHDEEQVTPGTDTLVRSLAIPDDNPEVRRAHELDIPARSYVEALAAEMGGRRAVAIAGTHGKTTTSAMIVHSLVHAGRDPSYVVGGDLVDGPSGRGGGGPDFVAEACEYRESFLRLPRDVGVILNVEADHLDWFGSEAAVHAAFHRFAKGVPAGGVLVVSESALAALPPLPSGVRTVVVGLTGTPAREPKSRVAHQVRGEVLPEVNGFQTFRVAADDVLVQLSVLGGHVAENALTAYAVLRELGLSPIEARDGLESFRGVHRRMEVISEDAPTLVSDYAHHPTELRAVAEAARSRWPGRRLLAVFQPHQASRTRSFLEGFADALGDFDIALISDIYAARDSDATLAAVSSRDVAAAAVARGLDVTATGDLAKTSLAVRALMRADDVILLLGAGDIDGLRQDFANDLLPDS